MQEYYIQRWDNTTDTDTAEADLEQYVPPEVEAIAWKVVELYDMTVSDMTLITAKPDKGGAIWRIETNKGPRSLKVLHRSPARSLFSIGAQEYVVRQGARVPSLIPAKNDMLYVEAGGKLWIVTDWIEPLQQASKIDLEGAAVLCKGLGEFHHHTKGYIPPELAQKSSRLHGWPKYYDKIIAKIGWFRDIAKFYEELPSSHLLLSIVDLFEKQGRDALDRLQNSSYSKMIAMGELHWGLVHQDYGWSNGQMGPGGIWVIDLDGVSYDLPIRDLRKLITSTMDDMGVWDVDWIRGMIKAYHEANPLDVETFEVLLIDMALPNEFYKHVKEIVFDPLNSMNSELEALLQRLMATEESKRAALAELAADAVNYKQGDYTDTPANHVAIREPSSFAFEGTPLHAGFDEHDERDDSEKISDSDVPLTEEDVMTIPPDVQHWTEPSKTAILPPSKRKKQAYKNKLIKKKPMKKKLANKKIVNKKFINKNFMKKTANQKLLKKKSLKTKKHIQLKKRKRDSA